MSAPTWVPSLTQYLGAQHHLHPQAAALEEPGVRAVKLETQPPAGPAQVPLFLLKANTADTKGSRMGRSGGLLQSRAAGRKGGETEEGLWVLGRVCVS